MATIEAMMRKRVLPVEETEGAAAVLDVGEAHRPVGPDLADIEPRAGHELSDLVEDDDDREQDRGEDEPAPAGGARRGFHNRPSIRRAAA